MTGAILITGASKGIGLATARHLADRGFLVLGTVRTELDGVRLRDLGVEPIRMDVTDPASIERAAHGVGQRLGERRLLAVVNNAGVPAVGPVELVDPEEVRRLFEVNVFGVVRVSQAFLPLLRLWRGRIVNMSSVSGRFAFPFGGVYAASKHALEALSDAMRRELRSAGIRVVVIQPGSVDTPIWDRVEELDVETYRGTPYEHLMGPVRDSAVQGGRTGLPPEAVARAVERAITMRRPPPRIPVVASRGRWLVQRVVPTAAWDALIGRMLARLETGGAVDSPLR